MGIPMSEVTIYIPLLEEGVWTARPTQAEVIKDNVYKVLPTADYSPEEEKWEYLPGTFVHCKKYTDPIIGESLLAYEIAKY